VEIGEAEIHEVDCWTVHDWLGNNNAFGVGLNEFVR